LSLLHKPNSITGTWHANHFCAAGLVLGQDLLKVETVEESFMKKKSDKEKKN